MLYVRFRNVDKVGELSAEYIAFYSWWSILAEELAVHLTMDLVTDITTGERFNNSKDLELAN